MFSRSIFLVLGLVVLTSSNNNWKSRSCANLNIGQFKCKPPLIDDLTQSQINCTPNGSVTVPCYPAENIICEEKQFDGKTIGFFMQVPCRYVTSYHYQTAVLLSIFLGIFGIDRIYLGYIAIGVLKACTFGFMLVGYLVDLLLIITHTLKPSDGSEYIVDFYGQIIFPTQLYNNRTYNLTYE